MTVKNDPFTAYDGDPLAPRIDPPTSFSRRKSFTAAELQVEEFPEMVYVIDRILAPGSTILAGKPKVNKTWLALDIALAVADGGKACGEWDAPRGDVLYLACEDNARRLQGRLSKLKPTGDWPDTLTFRTLARKLGEGFREEIADWVAVNEHPVLVIADTYHFIRPPRAKLTYEGDYQDSSAMTRIADDLQITILGIHHQRKATGEDALDTVSGTTGVAAGFDSILTLERAPEGGFTLEGRGRDLPDFRYALCFDKDTCRWSFVGDADTARIGDTRRRIIELLDGGTYGPTQAANALGIELETVKKTMQRMYDAGQIQKIGRGLYAGANATVF